MQSLFLWVLFLGGAALVARGIYDIRKSYKKEEKNIRSEEPK